MRVSFAVIETLVKETFSRTCETLTCSDCPFRQAGYKFRKKCQDLNVYEILAWMEFTAQPYADDPDQIMNWNDAIERSGKL